MAGVPSPPALLLVPLLLAGAARARARARALFWVASSNDLETPTEAGWVGFFLLPIHSILILQSVDRSFVNSSFPGAFQSCSSLCRLTGTFVPPLLGELSIFTAHRFPLSLFSLVAPLPCLLVCSARLFKSRRLNLFGMPSLRTGLTPSCVLSLLPPPSSLLPPHSRLSKSIITMTHDVGTSTLVVGLCG